MKNLFLYLFLLFTVISCNSQDDLIGLDDQQLVTEGDITTKSSSTGYSYTVPVNIYRNANYSDYYYSIDPISSTKNVKGVTYYYYGCHYRVVSMSAPSEYKVNSSLGGGVYMYYHPTWKIHRLTYYSPEYISQELSNTSYGEYVFEKQLGWFARVPGQGAFITQDEINEYRLGFLQEYVKKPINYPGKETLLSTLSEFTDASVWAGYNSLHYVYKIR